MRRAPAMRRAVATYGLLVVGSLVTLVPLIVVAITAFFPAGTPIDGFSVPPNPTFETFASAWSDGGLAAAFRTSILVAVLVVAVVSICSVLAGYAIGVLRFPGSRLLMYVFIAGIVTPYVALVIPMYFQFRQLGLLGSHMSLVLAESGLYLGFGVFWMTSIFRSIPPSLVEAARLDGAGPVRTLWSILLPVSRPALVALMVLTFLSSWNEYLVPLILGGASSTPTVSLSLASFQGQHLTDVPSLAAASLIVAGPTVILYLVSQRTFFRGLLEGAVK